MKKIKDIKSALVVLDKIPKTKLVFDAFRTLKKKLGFRLRFLVVLHHRLPELVDIDLKQVTERTRQHLQKLVPEGSKIEVEYGEIEERVLVALKSWDIPFLVLVGNPRNEFVKVIRTAMVPALILNEEKEFPGTKIGVPLGVTHRDHEALNWAYFLKEKLNLPVSVMRFFSIPGYDYIKALNLTDSIEKVDHEFENMQKEKVEQFLSKTGLSNIVTETIIEHDTPKSGILRSVKEYEVGILVMTIKRVSFLEEIFLGTITESILHHLPTHMLTVPVGGEEK